MILFIREIKKINIKLNRININEEFPPLMSTVHDKVITEDVPHQ